MADIPGTSDGDVLDGTADADQIFGGGGGDLISGNGGNDLLDGGAGADAIFGGSGDDTLIGGAGADSMSGGSGFDTVDFADNGTSGVVVDLSANAGSGSWQDAFGDSDNVDLATIEAYSGTSASDIMTGDATGGINPLNSAVFYGEGGNDTLTGSGLAELLDGGADHDSLSGLAGDDSLFGGTGDDTLAGGDNDDLLSGGLGADSIDGGDGFDTLSYASETNGVVLNLAAFGPSGGAASGDVVSNVEEVLGTEFDDQLTAMGETLRGEGGADTLSSIDGASDLFGGIGNDLLIVSGTSVSSGRIFDGGTGDNQLQMEGAQTLSLTGATIVNLAALRIALDGSTTVQLLASQSRQFSSYSAIGSGTARIEVIMATETVLDLSGIAITGFDQPNAGIVFTGDADSETITGTSIVDTIIGGGGNDMIMGGAGGDFLDGGVGLDTLSYANASTGVAINLLNGLGTLGDAAGDRLFGFEQFIGSSFADNIITGLDDETVEAGAGNDLIVGSVGADFLFGGAGNDRIAVTAGNLEDDVGYFGGDGAVDTLAITPGALFEIDLTELATGGLEVLEIGAGTGSADIHLTAEQAQGFTTYINGVHTGFSRVYVVDLDVDDQLDLSGKAMNGFDQPGDGFLMLGDDGNESIAGTSVVDTLLGNAGNDTLGGSAGADSLAGGSGFDTIDYSTSGVGVSVNLLTQTALGGGSDAEGDTISGFERAVGSGLNDELSGGHGSVLEGGEGADLIRVESGTSTALGQGGDDLIAIRGSSIQSGSTFDGGEGNDRLLIFDLAPGIQDLRDDTIIDFETLSFQSDLFDLSVHLLGSQITEFSEVEGSGANARLAEIDLGDDTSVDLSNLTFSGIGADEAIFRIIGSGDAEIITGSSVGDTVLADGGDDMVELGRGDDTADGGAGTDTLSFASMQEASMIAGTVQLGALASLADQGTVQATGAGNDTFSGFENLEGSDFSDLLVGDDAGNMLDGGAGGDLLMGGAGDDLLLGGLGFDALDGGAGADTLFGGTGGSAVEGDIATYFDVSGPLVFDFGADFTQIDASSSAEVRDDVIGADIEGIAGATGFSNTFDASELSSLSFFLGGAAADTFFGGTGTDQLVGLGGADVIYGGDGADGLIGEGGDDLLFGGVGGDSFFFDGVDGDDTIGDFDLIFDVIFFTGGAIVQRSQLTFTEADIGGNSDGDTVISYMASGQTSTITLFDVDADDMEQDALILFA